MKTKLFTLLLAVAASVGTMFAWDYERVQIGDLYYNLDATSQTAEVTYKSYTNFEYNEGWGITTANIPASVEYNSVTYSVTSIGSRAFYKCTGLTSLTIPNSVTSMGYRAFYICSSLTSVTIPNSVTSIGSSAFYKCTGLTSVTIGNSVTSIGYEAFSGCSGLTSINVASDNSNYCSVDGVLFNKDKTTLIQYPGGKQGAYTIPNSVTSIGEYAFYDCTGLTSVTIPNSVTSIGDGAFYYCTGLTSVTIPNGVTSIGKSAFLNCSGLTSVTIPNSVTSIGDRAFRDCSGLTSVTIGNSVTSIGESAFERCTGLTSVTIGNSVTSIGWYAFYDCSSLTSIYVPCGEMERFKQMLGGSYIKYAPYPYTITTYAQNGYISTNIDNYTICDALAVVTCTPVPDYGYHFVKWSDGNTDNPRTIILASDTTFTAEFAKNTYTISTTSANLELGTTSGDTTALYLDKVEISAIPNYGYRFVRWNDGNTSNPRTVSVTEDKTYTATFAKNVYSITKNAEHGTISGNSSAEYLDFVTLTVTPDYGYHFTQWSDGLKDNPRTIELTQDTTFTAEFAHNPVITYVYNAQMGSVSGPTMTATGIAAENITFNASPYYGYHFVQWNDGNTDNPRTIWLSQDTTFTAEFAPDRVGTCGKDLALVWSYDPTNKVLTIGNAGSFTENMQFGAEAPGEMEELVIGNSVTAIGANAFAGIETLKKITIGESVKTIGEQAFYNCVNLETIFNYRPTPTNTYSNAFDGVDKFECALYVLPSSIDMYKAAAVWRDFYYTYAIGAKEATVTTNDVKVEPQDNAATLIWPTSNNAASYTIEITKEGVVFCTLIFNANGQLTGIAFAPSRNGQAHAPAALMTANGLQFTVTGLNSGTQYGYNLTAKDANDQTVATYSGSFTTTSEGIATGVEEVSSSLQGGERGRLILHNGQIFILRDGKAYTLTGQLVR